MPILGDFFTKLGDFFTKLGDFLQNVWSHCRQVYALLEWLIMPNHFRLNCFRRKLQKEINRGRRYHF
jgi:hypothetical protein